MSAPFTLPVTRLVADQVPSDARSWVESALVLPLNRFMEPVAAALSRMLLSQVNVQVVEWKGLPPSATTPAEVVSALTGKCVGLTPIYCAQLDAGGTPATPIGGLSMPAWTEVASTDRSQGNKLRVTSQSGLTAGTRYLIRWLALGG